jgi:hypothetical protein
VIDVLGMQHFRPRYVLDAFARVLKKSLIQVSQLPILTRRPGKSRHVLDDQPSFAVAVMD